MSLAGALRAPSAHAPLRRRATERNRGRMQPGRHEVRARGSTAAQYPTPSGRAPRRSQAPGLRAAPLEAPARAPTRPGRSSFEVAGTRRSWPHRARRARAAHPAARAPRRSELPSRSRFRRRSASERAAPADRRTRSARAGRYPSTGQPPTPSRVVRRGGAARDRSRGVNTADGCRGRTRSARPPRDPATGSFPIRCGDEPEGRTARDARCARARRARWPLLVSAPRPVPTMSDSPCERALATTREIGQTPKTGRAAWLRMLASHKRPRGGVDAVGGPAVYPRGQPAGV